MRPVLVAGCGNAAGGYDAFGPLVCACLLRGGGDDGDGPHVSAEIIDLGTGPARLLDHLGTPDQRRELILLDAIVDPAITRSGRIVVLDWSQGTALPAGTHCWSCHGLSLAEQVELARVLDVLPTSVRVVGLLVSPADARAGARAAQQQGASTSGGVVPPAALAPAVRLATRIVERHIRVAYRPLRMR